MTSIVELDDPWQTLVALAQRVSRNAWCPYSRFPVGSALETDRGTRYSGCNVESASFGLTLCAERNAIGHAIAAEGQILITRMVVYTPTETATTPCGACRQVINELSHGTEILCVCQTSHTIARSIHDLLPDAFGGETIQKSPASPS